MLKTQHDTDPFKCQVSIFKNVKPRKCISKAFDLQGMITNPVTHIKKKKSFLPLFKMAVMGDTPNENGYIRHDANVKALTGQELDYDGGELSFEDARRLLEDAGIICVMYTSPSHTEDFPKWRVILPFSREITQNMPNFRHGTVDLCETILGVTFNKDSRTLSQSYYFGKVAGVKYKTAVNPEGIYIDQHMDHQLYVLDAGERKKEPLDVQQAIDDMGENITDNVMAVMGKMIAASIPRDLVISTITQAIEESGRDEHIIQARIRDLPRNYKNALRLDKQNHPDRSEPEVEPEALDEDAGLDGWTIDQDDGVELIKEELVQGLMHVDAASLLVAHYNVGKSAFAVDLAAHIASGQSDWCGQQIQHLPVLYLAAEGPGSVRSRIRAYARDGWNLEDLHVISHQGWSLSSADARRALKKKVMAYCRKYGIKKVGLIIIDTLAEASAGLDENSTAMGDVMSWGKKLAGSVHGHLMVLHHKAKHSEGSRGHTSLPAAVDTIWELKDNEGIVTAKITKQRDLPGRGDGIQFRIVSQETGQVTNFGDKVTVARVEYTTAFGQVDEDVPQKLTKVERLAEAIDLFLSGCKDGTWKGFSTHLADLAWGENVDIVKPEIKSATDKLVNSERLVVTGKLKNTTWTRIPLDLDKG